MRPSETFAARVKDVRTAKGWTQQQLADRLGELGRTIDRAALARIEHGDRQVSIDDMIEICAALGPSPIHMIIPIAGTDEPLVDLAPKMTLSPREARQWMRGQNPLRKENVRTYYTEVSAEELKQQFDRSLSLLMSLAKSVVEAVEESADRLDQDARNVIADRIDMLNRELEHQNRREKESQ